MYIMVLNDGETFTNLEGCQIREVPDDFDEIDNGKAGECGRMVREFTAEPIKLCNGKQL